MEELVPDRQREAEVDVLGSVQLVVDAVEVRADEDPIERSEPQVGVRMGEGDHGPVDDEERRRQRTVGQQHDRRDERDQVRDVNQGMRPEDGQDAHVLLGVVELVEAPQQEDAMVGEMGKPVAAVHRHEDHRRRGPTWQRVASRQDDPREGRAGDLGEREGERRHEGNDERRVEHREEEILTMTAGDQRSPLRRSHPLRDEKQSDRHEAGRADHDDTKT